jgi:hypothetical protein
MPAPTKPLVVSAPEGSVESVETPHRQRRVRQQSSIGRGVDRTVDLLDSTISTVENSLGVANDGLLLMRGIMRTQLINEKQDLKEDMQSRGMTSSEIEEALKDYPY